MTRAAETVPSQPQLRTSMSLLITLWEPGRGGRDMIPGSARSRPRARAGRVSVPRSMARICRTVSGSGTDPAERANTRKGTTSGVRWAKM